MITFCPNDSILAFFFLWLQEGRIFCCNVYEIVVDCPKCCTQIRTASKSLWVWGKNNLQLVACIVTGKGQRKLSLSLFVPDTDARGSLHSYELGSNVKGLHPFLYHGQGRCTLWNFRPTDIRSMCYMCGHMELIKILS